MNSQSFSEWIENALRCYTQPVITDRGRPYAGREILEPARALASKLASLEGKVVLLQESSGAAFLMLLLALSRIKAVIAPVSASTLPAELERVARILGAAASVKCATETSEPTITFFEVPRPVPLPSAMHDDASFIRFTSGTTGDASGVCVTSLAAIQRATSTAAGLELARSDKVLWLLPMEQHFIAGLLAFLREGITIVVPKGRTRANLSECSDVSVLFAAPSEIRLLTSNFEDMRFPKLRVAAATTGPISDEDCIRFEAATGVPVSRVFGAIEVGIALGNVASTSSGRFSKIPNSLGYPFPGYEVKICRGAFEGRLAFRGPGLSAGYVDSSNSRAIVRDEDGFFVTADIAKVLEDGSFQILGRANSVINVAGHKVFPEEIEAVLQQHHGVAEVLVKSMPHAVLGSIVSAQIVLKADSEVSPKSLRQHCRLTLQPWKVPQEIHFVKQLEKTTTGKIRRWT